MDFLNISILKSHCFLYFELINSERDRTKNMKKKILFLTFGLIFSNMKSTAPSLVDSVHHKNPLVVCNNCNDWIENKLIELLDHVIEAKRYWLTVEDRPWYRVITRPIHHWFNFSWQTEIREHLSTLDDLQSTLAIKLSKHITHNHGSDLSEETKEDIYKLISHANSILKTHGVPLHVMRNWVFYVGAAVAAYKAAQLYQAYLQDTVIFKFDIKDKDTVISACRDAGENYSLMEEGNTFWLTTSQTRKAKFEDTETVKEKFEDKLKKYPKIIYTYTGATFNDLRKLLLDRNGQFLGTTLVEKCFINPSKKIYNKLKNDNESKKNNYCLETQEANNRKYQEAKIIFLNKLVNEKNPQGINQFPDIVAALEHHGSFEGLSPETLDDLIGRVSIPFFESSKKAFFDAAKQLFKELQSEPDKAGVLKSWFDYILKSAESSISSISSKPFDDTPEGAYVRKLEAQVNAEYPEIKNGVSTFIDALEFLTETAKMTPFFLTLYVGYKSTNGAAQWYRDTYFKEPLRYDLKDFINFLDENIYTHINNPTFKGLHYYWTARLKRYKSFMDSKNRIYFEKDLQKLTRGSSISHEIETLRVILYDELEHF